MTSTLDFPLNEASIAIIRQCEYKLSQVLRDKFDCEASFDGVESMKVGAVSSQTGGEAAGAERFFTKLASGVQVHVWKMDLTEFKVQAVVNAANRSLNHCGGLALALSIAGGPEIKKESIAYVESHGSLKTGEAVMLGAGRLQCQKIIHAVGPQLASSSLDEFFEAEQKLEMVIQSVLEIVEKHQLQSVAIPAISSGIFGFPRRRCADIIVSTIKRFYASKRPHLPRYIHLVNHDEPTTFEMERACRHILNPGALEAERTATKNKQRSYPNEAAVGSKHPRLRLSGSSKNAAKRWLQKLFDSKGTVVIQNNFLLHMGKQDFQHLLELNLKNVNIQEIFNQGRAVMAVIGDSAEAVLAAVEVEALLCHLQKEFMMKEYAELHRNSPKMVVSRTVIEKTSDDFLSHQDIFGKEQLRILKMEKLENSALGHLFNLKCIQLECKSFRNLYQCIPAHFFQVVAHVGFHAELAPPTDPAYGEGIYFTGSVKSALEVWQEQGEEYLYFVEAIGLTEPSTRGERGLILPPAVQSEPRKLYSSVTGPDVWVIFNGYQALPCYLITCMRMQAASSRTSCHVCSY